MTAGKKAHGASDHNESSDIARVRNHKFESFTQRVAKLKIDPIRRNRRQELVSDDSQSHFQNGLTYWRESNLSESFSKFVQEVDGLCDSLPQILHHKTKLAEILMGYLEERNILSLEPLLNLTSCLAHDLGVRFEEYFPAVLRLILDIAAKHKDVEAVEWSFSCLAWLFKYLSALLVPDLRPTYDLVAKALGKENHKPFIARFAAESLSFLVRKAASMHSKNTEPLNRIVKHVFMDFDGSSITDKHLDVYRYGIMSLFANAIKGVDNEFHTTGPDIFRSLLRSASSQGSEDLIIGVLTSSIHHGNASTIEKVLQVFYDHIDLTISNSEEQTHELSLGLLLTLAAVRRGSRINDWTPVFLRIFRLVDLTSKSQSSYERRSFMLARTAAVVFTTASQQSCFANVRLVDKLYQRLNAQAFLSFCTSLADLNQDRFSQLVLPSFFKHLATIEGIKQDVCLFTALQISDHGIEFEPNRHPTQACQTYLQEICRPESADEVQVSRCASILELLPKFNLAATTKENIGTLLMSSIEQECAQDDSTTMSLRAFYLGPALRTAIQYSSISPPLREILHALPTFSTMPVYLQNLRQIVSLSAFEIDEEAGLNLVSEAAKNLPSPSKELRRYSLELLQTYHKRFDGQVSAALDTALQLEDLVLDVKSARTASMHVRRLSEQYQSLENNSWLLRVIPLYCFGILHLKLGQVRIEAINALKQMSSNATAATAIADLVFEWLETDCGFKHEFGKPTNDNRFKYNEFRCSTMDNFSKTLTKTELDLDNATECLQDRYTRAYASHSRKNDRCHTFALEVLKHLPELAEKKSRQLVPIFLKFCASDVIDSEENDKNLEDSEKDDNVVADQTKWLSKRDQLGFLEIFGLFVNPRMLYKAEEVHGELFKCLSSGDIGIQKAALKALSTWKSASLDAYMENFNNLLDETRFREELTMFLDPENTIKDVDFPNILPVLLRLLYGRVISKSGSTSSKGSLTSKRRAVFDALARLDAHAIREFANIALGSLRNLEYDGSKAVSTDLGFRAPTQRQQLGLLNLTKDMIDSLGEKVVPALSSILMAILFCGQNLSIIEDEIASATEKNIRRMCLQCLTSISSRTSTEILSQYLSGIFNVFITPRLKNLAIESNQSVSAILQLLSVWADSTETCLWLVDYNADVLNAVTAILTTPAAKEPVLLFVMNGIVRPIARFADSTETVQRLRIRQHLIRPNTSLILERIGTLLESDPQRQVLSAALSLLSDLAGSVEHTANIKMLIHLSTSLLSQPASNVPPKSKGDILGFLVRFIPLSDLRAGDDLLKDLESALVPLLLYFKDRESRILLSQVLAEVSLLDVVLQSPSRICKLLDAYSITTLDEPDFDSRLQAFREIESEASRFLPKQWEPLLFSLLYHVQDTDELIIRSSSSTSLKNFVITAATSDDSQSAEMRQMLENIVLPALKRGAGHKSELVRSEYLSIFAETIRQFSSWAKINDLSLLLVNDDEEASFFNNILHIQQHRRLRALRRLAAEASKGSFQSHNIAHFLIPLLEHFILDHPDDNSEHNVAFESIVTLGRLALGLEWPQFRAMFRRYTNYVLTNPELEKSAIRLLTIMTDALSQVVKRDNIPDQDMSVDEEMTKETTAPLRLQLTLPKGDKLSEDIAKSLSMPLRQYVHHKDETLVSQRVPVAATVAKMIMLLSDHQIAQQLPPLLTDVCQILRSRTQESRDLARKTLMDISKTVGPRYIGFILKELRTALPRGYQLHVLSFTTHMLLVTNEATIDNGELDYCLTDIVNIIMDDMFGATGQEKDAEGYISQMREIKTNKSYDSMEIIARVSSLERINTLLRPIIALLEERLDLRMLKKIDELLRRTGVGLLKNAAIQSQAALVLSFEILKQVYSKEKSTVERPIRDYRKQRFLINMRSIKKSEVSHATSSATHKVARFAFDLLRIIFSRQEQLQTPANVLGFMPSIAEGVMSSHEEVQVSVFRLLATIIRVPLAQLDKNAPVYVSEAMNLIKNATTASSEPSQAALKLITVFIRDRDNATVKESDISYLLKKIKTDLDEPDRQGITFNFLKAVLHRKVVVAETYEIMDVVAAMMIQNQSVSARNVARGLYVQFLVNFPQGTERLKKQWAFLIKNLDYNFETGRQSVLETVHSLLVKVGENTVQDIISNFFAPLVLATVNDESMECRKMSAILLKEFFKHSTEDTLAKMVVLLRSWIIQEDQQMLTRIALQTFTLYIESSSTKAERDLLLLTQKIENILENSDPGDAPNEWELVYYSLQFLSKAVSAHKTRLFCQESARLWQLIILRSDYPHAWVKSVASKLLGQYFADFASAQAEQRKVTLPLIGSGGLRLDMDSMMKVTQSSLKALRTVGINEDFANQLVRNTVFLGQLFNTLSGGQTTLQDSGDIQNEQQSEDEDEVTEENHTPTDPLAFIFARISFVLRRDATGNRAVAMIPKTACLSILTALCKTLPAEAISENSISILMPLHVITDSSTSVPFSTDEGFKTAHANMIVNAQDLLATLQGKLGSSQFMEKLNQVREQIKIKRDERKVKRRIEAVAEPEKTGYKRLKKRSQQREQRKSKNAAYRAQRRGW